MVNISQCKQTRTVRYGTGVGQNCYHKIDAVVISTSRGPYDTHRFNMVFSPSNSVCVVTGGGSGIGRALCHELVSRGASKVIVVDINFLSAQKVVSELLNDVGFAMKADVGKESDIRNIIEKTETLWGPIDAFFCNAGITSSKNDSEEEWQKMWQVNVMQSVYVARHLMPKFVERKKGALLVTASAAGLLTLIGDLPYTVTKHAALGLAEWLRITYGSSRQHTIQISCLCPQAVQTNMLGGKDPTPIWGGKILSPSSVATTAIDAMMAGTFLILPHTDVKKYVFFKAKNHEQWIKGMYKIHHLYLATIKKEKQEHEGEQINKKIVSKL